MSSLLATAIAAFAAAVLLALYASGPSEHATGKRCPAASATAAAAFCLPDSNGHLRLAQRTNAWERFKGAVTGKP